MAWLSNWQKRLKFEIDYTKVSAALSNFPVLLRIHSGSGITTEDLSDLYEPAINKKFAVTTSDGTTQCYCEILDDWNGSDIACIWTCVPSVSNSANTVLYFYFDEDQAANTSYVGGVQTEIGFRVWDSDFLIVHHCNESSWPAYPSDALASSRYQIRAVTPFSDSSAPDISSAGKVQTCWDFDSDVMTISGSKSGIYELAYRNTASIGGSPTMAWGSPAQFGGCITGQSITNYLYWSDNARYTPANQFTIEGWIRITTLPSSGGTALVMAHYASSNTNWRLYVLNTSGTYTVVFKCVEGGVTIFDVSGSFGGTPSTNTWYHIAVSRDANNDIRLYRDGVQRGSTTNDDSTFPDIGGSLYLFRDHVTNTGLIGQIEQVRFSKVARYTGSSFSVQSMNHAVDSDTLFFVPGHSISPTIQNAGKGTVEVLYRPEAISGSESHALYWEGTDTYSYGRFALTAKYVSGNLRAFARYTTGSTTPTFSLTDSVDLSLNTWYHLCTTVDADTEAFVLYKNGSSVASDSSSKSNTQDTAPYNVTINIGNANDGSTNQFPQGKYEELRYSRIARSAAWVNATYNACFDTLITWDALEDAEELPTATPALVKLDISPLDAEGEAADYHQKVFGSFSVRSLLIGLSQSKKPSMGSTSRTPSASLADATAPAATCTQRRPTATVDSSITVI